MTNEEAIETLKVARLVITESPNVVDAEFKRYSKSVDTAIESLEKQIPKKSKQCQCPKCDATIYQFIVCRDSVVKYCFMKKQKYCANCGQALLWEDEHDK